MMRASHKFFLFFALVGLVGGASTILALPNDYAPQTVKVPLKTAYIPMGFDSNDRVQIVVQGTFPNTSYKVGPHQVKVDTAQKTIRISQSAYQYHGISLQMIVPFNRVIDLGLLPEGKYKIIDDASGATLGELEVRAAVNPGPDDALYAPVGEAYVTKEASSGRMNVVLEGTFTEACMRLREVQVDYQGKVVVVKPVAARDEKADCRNGQYDFYKVVPLAADQAVPFLLHVRSMNGEAVNKVVDYFGGSTISQAR